jgi:hypothetical protein
MQLSKTCGGTFLTMQESASTAVLDETDISTSHQSIDILSRMNTKASSSKLADQRPFTAE